MQTMVGAASLGTTVPDMSRVHVVGIGGSGVRGLVPILLARGAKVSGSDKDDSPVLRQFRQSGVDCWVGHSDEHVSPATNLLLISAAVTKDNPEVRAAEERAIRVLKYSQLLGLLMSERTGIAIAGTHGKTTTTAMTCFVLVEAGLDPSFLIGGEHPDLGGGSRSGKGRHFIAEACEFDRSFLNLHPRAAAVTNIEADHLDYFGSLEEIQDAFGEFARRLPNDGLLVWNKEDPNSAFLPLSTVAETQSFSLVPGTADWTAEDIRFHDSGSTFRLRGPDGKSTVIRLQVPGYHNIRNALASTALASWAGVPLEVIACALGRFRPVRRRFDVLATSPCTVVDDYAHHPTEVRAVIDSARRVYPGRRLVCVFQPHQHSRLRVMLEDFADALSEADEVIVCEVYRARDSEEDVRAIRSTLLAEAVRRRGRHTLYADTFCRVIGQLEGSVEAGAVVLFLGAGDITHLAHEFARAVASRDVVLREPPRRDVTAGAAALVCGASPN